MAETVILKRGFSALYIIENAMRVIEGLRASDNAEASIDTLDQFQLADTIVNVGPELDL